MTEQELYDNAVDGMNEKGRYRLANLLAHKYDLVRVEKTTTIRRQSDGKVIIIFDDGDMVKGADCR